MEASMRLLWLVPLLVGCTGDQDDTGGDGGDGGSSGDPYLVKMETSLGNFDIALDPVLAPVTTENFLVYVDEGFFDGRDGEGATIFHRVISGFMNQGGGYTADGTLKDTHAAIDLESQSGLSNTRGTIAMARTNSPNSATTQFFINTVDNLFLDYVDAASPGYAVFGEVVSGMEAVDAIAEVATNNQDTPLEDVVITSCVRESD